MTTVKFIDSDSYVELLNKIELIDEKLSSFSKEKSNRKKWLTNKEVCEILDVTTRTLQNYRDNGVLSFSKAGSMIYYKEEDIEEFLLHNYHKGFCSK